MLREIASAAYSIIIKSDPWALIRDCALLTIFYFRRQIVLLNQVSFCFHEYAFFSIVAHHITLLLSLRFISLPVMAAPKYVIQWRDQFGNYRNYQTQHSDLAHKILDQQINQYKTRITS